MKTRILMIIAAGLFLLFCACADKVSGGEGSSTEVVIGLIVDSVGVPVEGAVVNLYPSDYNPVVKNGEDRLSDTSDENGFCKFEIEEVGAYSIVCEAGAVGNNRYGSMSVCTTSVESDTIFDTMFIEFLVAKTVAVLESAVDTVGGYLYIPGTDYSVPFAKAVKSDGYYSFTFDAIPQGEIVTVNLSSTEKPDIDVVIEEDVKVFDPVWYKVHSSGVDSLKNVHHIIQDSGGGIWFVTANSLLRLKNMNEWIQYDIQPVSDIEADLNSGVWVVYGLANISHYDGSNWITFDSLDFDLISGVGYVTVQSEDTVWFGNRTGNKGPFNYVKSTDSWASVVIPGGETNNSIYGIEYSDGELWAATYEGCAEFNGGSWSHIGKSVMGMNSGYPRNLDIVPDGGVWFSGSYGVSHYNGSGWDFYDTLTSDLHSLDLYDIAHDSEGRVFVSTAKGLASYYGGEWKEHSGDAGTPPSVDKVLYSAMVDRDGNIWVGGFDAGVYVMGPTAEKYGN